MKALKKHPNIIELIDVIDDERKDKKYIVLELANGCNLQELLLSAPDSVRAPRGGCGFVVVFSGRPCCGRHFWCGVSPRLCASLWCLVTSPLRVALMFFFALVVVVPLGERP